MAQDMCTYFSKCYVVRNPVAFDNLEQQLRDSVTQAGQHYEQNLRHPGDGLTAADISAETPAQQRKSQRDKENLIDEMVQGIDSAVKAEVTRQKKIEPKLMPATKKSPPDLPASVAAEEPKKKTKPPPACAKVQDPKPPPKHLAKSASASTDTTVKVEPKQSEAPPPPPPKKGTDTTVKTEKTEETSDSTTKRKNKIVAESGGPSPSSASSSRPHPIPPAPPVRTPQQPDHPPPKIPKQPGYPPPDRPDKPATSPRKPFDHGKFPHPTPPAPPVRVLGEFWQNMKQSDIQRIIANHCRDTGKCNKMMMTLSVRHLILNTTPTAT